MADRNPTLPAFGPYLADYARRAGVAGFWRWWMRQLDSLVPAAPRAALARRRMKPVLVFDGAHATLWRSAVDERRALMIETAQIPVEGDPVAVTAVGRAALAALAGVAYGGLPATTRVVIALRPRDVLRKKIVVPLALEENLQQALAYDLDRHTPFKADELYFDAAVVHRDVARGTIEVDLGAVRRVVADPLLRLAAAWGADVVALVPEPPAQAASSRLNLLPLDSRSRSNGWSRWQFWLPIAVFAVLVLATVLIPLWQKRDFAIDLDAIVSQSRAQAAVSEKLREELDARVGDYNVALERKYAFPGALQVVDNVSKLLPDDTWLTQFELKTVSKGKEVQRELLVRGETGNAGRLVQLFEESQLFTQASPRSPTTKIQPGPGEIFDLGAQLKPLPAPPRLPIVVAETGAVLPAAAPTPAIPPSAPAAAVPVPAATTPAPTPPASPPPPAASNAPRNPGGVTPPVVAPPPAAAMAPAPTPTPTPRASPSGSARQ